MNNPVRMPGYGASRSVDTDAGLRAHMLGVFRNMGLGLVITGLVAALGAGFAGGGAFPWLLSAYKTARDPAVQEYAQQAKAAGCWCHPTAK